MYLVHWKLELMPAANQILVALTVNFSVAGI